MKALLPTPVFQPATGSVSPSMRRASAAQTSKVEATRSISTRLSLTGLPSSRASSRASRSRWFRAATDARCRISARAAGASVAT